MILFGNLVVLLYYLIMQKRNRVYREKVFVKIIRYILIVLLLPIVIVFAIKRAVIKAKKTRQNKEKIAIFDMSQIDSMSGEEFERLLKEVFECLGYDVKLTKKSHDFGADLVVSKKGVSSLVQAKCYGKTVGIKAVQEIIASRKHYGVNDVIVATNNYFSKEAQLLADENDVVLMDRDVLFNLIKKYDVHIDTSAKKYVATSADSVREIEAKYRFWI